MSVLAYNPGMESSGALLDAFVARRALFERLVEGLGALQPEHHLLVGQRGMGKTTLLRRLAVEIDRSEALRGRWMALTFPEEQYNVARLSDFWLNCLDALADAYEREGDTASAEELDAIVAALPPDEPRRAGGALERLLAATGAGRGLVLFVDNLQQVFDRLDRDARWALRKVLGGEARLVVIAASATLPVGTTDYGEPFYDFFHTHWLRGLDLRETTEVLQHIAGRSGDAAVVDMVAEHPARVRALHVLTGGNPRTLVQLAQVLGRTPGGDIRPVLEGLVDQSTPLYKARFEALSDQAQVVLDALALRWDPATAAEVAESARVEVNVASTHLHRLYLDGVVEKVELPEGARQGFQVAERFFNLWYLMRASRRQRGRVLALARCLEALYSTSELTSLGQSLAGAPGDPDLMVALLLTRSVEGAALRQALTSGAIDALMGLPEQLDSLAGALGGAAPAVGDVVERKRRVAAALEAAKAVDWAKVGLEAELGEVFFAVVASVEPCGAAVIAAALETEAVRKGIAAFGDLRALLGPRAWPAYRRAWLTGELTSRPGDRPGPREEGDAAGIRVGYPHLYAAVLVAGEGDLSEPADRAAVMSNDDPWLLSAAARRARGSAGVQFAEAACRLAPELAAPWEALASALARAFGSPEGDPASRLGRVVIAAREAIRIGSMDGLCVGLCLPFAESEAEAEALARRLMARGDASAALWSGVCASSPSPLPPATRRKLWDLHVAHHDPVDAPERLYAFMRLLIAQGRADEALEVVLPLRDRALPVYAAVVAAQGKDLRLLSRFAPEVALPARELLASLWPEGVERPVAPRPRRRHRPTSAQ